MITAKSSPSQKTVIQGEPTENFDRAQVAAFDDHGVPMNPSSELADTPRMTASSLLEMAPVLPAAKTSTPSRP